MQFVLGIHCRSWLHWNFCVITKHLLMKPPFYLCLNSWNSVFILSFLLVDCARGREGDKDSASWSLVLIVGPERGVGPEGSGCLRLFFSHPWVAQLLTKTVSQSVRQNTTQWATMGFPALSLGLLSVVLVVGAVVFVRLMLMQWIYLIWLIMCNVVHFYLIMCNVSILCSDSSTNSWYYTFLDFRI